MSEQLQCCCGFFSSFYESIELNLKFMVTLASRWEKEGEEKCFTAFFLFEEGNILKEKRGFCKRVFWNTLVEKNWWGFFKLKLVENVFLSAVINFFYFVRYILCCYSLYLLQKQKNAFLKCFKVNLINFKTILV